MRPSHLGEPKTAGEVVRILLDEQTRHGAEIALLRYLYLRGSSRATSREPTGLRGVAPADLVDPSSGGVLGIGVSDTNLDWHGWRAATVSQGPLVGMPPHQPRDWGGIVPRKDLSHCGCRRGNTRPQIQRLLDQLIDTPAFVVGKYLDILAWNPLAAALLIDVDKMAPHERNYVRMMFTDPRMKDYYEDWESMARTGVALLRMQAVENPTDPRLAALVGELSVSYPQFRRWWAARNVARQEFGTKTIRHPELGALTIDWDGFQWAGDPTQQLIIWTAEPGSPTHDKLRILSSWIQAPSPSPQNAPTGKTDS